MFPAAAPLVQSPFTTPVCRLRFFALIAGIANAADQKPAANPGQHVRAGMPPTLFIEGENDTLKIGRTEMMGKLKNLGIDTGVHTLKDAPHPFWMSQPWLDQTVEVSASFFKKHLGEPVVK